MPIPLADIALLIVAGFAAGLVNAIAGGGTFFSFPALLFAGVPPISANASNSVALWPASLAGAWEYRSELRKYGRILVPLSILSLCGGAIGGLILVSIREAMFEKLIPWLLLFATTLFAFSRHIAVRTSSLTQPPGGSGHRIKRTVSGIAYFLVAIYGGFFGAGMGILLLASLSISGYEDIHEINAIKNLLSAVIYSVSVVTFVAAGAISWPEMFVMLVAATAGGFYGARVSRLIPTTVLRYIVIAVGLALSLVYFIKKY